MVARASLPGGGPLRQPLPLPFQAHATCSAAFQAAQRRAYWVGRLLVAPPSRRLNAAPPRTPPLVAIAALLREGRPLVAPPSRRPPLRQGERSPSRPAD
ncbi:MAG TPA: hypothetical protein VH599_09430 [Ktedonobacterales bacterium]